MSPLIVRVALLTTVWILGASGNNGSGENFPVGDPRRCMSSKGDPTYRFEVLPGGGWDNLQNKEMGLVISYNYSQCRTTDDGRYLLPDGVYTIPLKSSKVETFAELITHWTNYTSTLSRSVNAHAGLNLPHVGISGSFSYEYKSVKSEQHLDKSVTTRIQARYLQYTSRLEPDTTISEAFQKRLYKIAADVTLNRTALAQYDAQLLVRDFGTHVITSMDVGAALVQVDGLSLDYMKKYASQKQTVLASASASFFGVFDFGGSYSQTTTKEEVETYKKSRTSSHIMTYGGEVFRPKNYTADDWSKGIANDLIAMDRSGDPIYYLITQSNLPDVPENTVFDVYDQVKNAVEAYYEHNAYRGCTDPEARNFNFQANIDDGTCKPPKTNFTFGGVYQTCQNSGVDNLCDKMTQKNPQTGSYSCPSGYEAVPLQSGSKQSSRSERKCHRCWLIAHCCHTETYHSHATYTAYWCAATKEVPQNSGFLFGGVYTNQVDNILTQSKSCPLKFYPLTLLQNLHVCVSDDYEFGAQYSAPFAGFYSCNAGNPLALKERSNLLKSSMLNSFMLEEGVGSYPKTCPEGYSQHLAVIDNSCSIHYCLKTGALSQQGLPVVQRPPYMAVPRDIYTMTDSLDVVFNDPGSIWTIADNANKVMPKYLQGLGLNPMTTMASAPSGSSGFSSNTSTSLSTGGILGISIGATLLCVFVATVIIVKVKRGKARYREVDTWSQSDEGRPILPETRA